MTTTLYLDEATKQKAGKKAKQDKLSMSAIMRILLTDYANGKIQIGARTVTQYEVSHISVDDETQTKMDKIAKKWHSKKI